MNKKKQRTNEGTKHDRGEREEKKNSHRTKATKNGNKIIKRFLSDNWILFWVNSACDRRKTREKINFFFLSRLYVLCMCVCGLYRPIDQLHIYTIIFILLFLYIYIHHSYCFCLFHRCNVLFVYFILLLLCSTPYCKTWTHWNTQGQRMKGTMFFFFSLFFISIENNNYHVKMFRSECFHFGSLLLLLFQYNFLFFFFIQFR